MFDADVLQQTVALLSSYGGKRNVDPAFARYQRGINGAFKAFVTSSMGQPLAEQLAYIEQEMKKKDGIKATLETASSGKRTWTLVFALAAAAVERKNALPEDSPEREPINTLLSGLSNGWINGFGSLGFGIKLNHEAINALCQGLDRWIEQYDIHQLDPTITQETLLSSYAIMCYFEETMKTSRMAGFLPEDLKVMLPAVKEKIAAKFNALQETLTAEKSVESSHAVIGRNLVDDDNPLTRFKAQLAGAKRQQQVIQRKTSGFDEAQCERMQQLQQVLLTDDDSLQRFWQHINTKEKFTQLMDDLHIPDNKRAGWLEYFNYQHGSVGGKLKAAFWTGSWGMPTALGGVEAGTVSRQGLTACMHETLARLSSEVRDLTGEELSADKPEEFKPYARRAQERAERSIVLLEDMEVQLEALADLQQMDVASLTAHWEGLIEKSQPENHDVNGIRVIYQQVLEDIDKAKSILFAQEDRINRLAMIEETLTSLSAQGLDIKDLHSSFDAIVSEVYQKAMVDTGFVTSSKPSTSNVKINEMRGAIKSAAENMVSMKHSINELVSGMKEDKQQSVIQKANEFIAAREKSLGHLFLRIFSPSYRKMFNHLKTVVRNPEVNDQERFESITHVFGLTDESQRPQKMAKQFRNLKAAVEVAVEAKKIVVTDDEAPSAPSITIRAG
ncbi:hypothetical protein [Legionella nagasakiensis]|uniref:hypothetical protein n=1 Tax=Legionella nagasakiensis TaxID=535290 RepID=UPI001055A231|nr:hypothetical protein [Legionella nagasakiensis]